ncbi:hypothetical protein [Pseudomonas putida]|jgi:hypothetical protein|uniref:hypothetical protein n=1 Tax=Pseudomonas putida TaxID=303 RepID=UPI001374774E|nr:hypothetical protein [Pseudomonas putida]
MCTTLENATTVHDDEVQDDYAEWFKIQIEASLNDDGVVVDDETASIFFARKGQELLGD